MTERGITNVNHPNTAPTADTNIRYEFRLISESTKLAQIREVGYLFLFHLSNSFFK
jgi:hypothetical protein